MNNTKTTIAGALLLIVIGAGIKAARSQQPVDERDRDAANRITALSASLRFNGDEPDASRRLHDLDGATKRLFSEVDHFIQASVTASESSHGAQSRLRTVLSAHKPNPEYADLPFARFADLRAGRSLLVAYTIVRGPHNDVATIRGYRARPDQGLELVATAGDDFDGYSMFKSELASPFPDEIWLLSWGINHTFNGRLTRFRVYAFDGQDIKTVWAPADVFNASVSKIDGVTFSIDHEVRYPPYDIHDEYLVTPNGITKTK